MTDTVALIKERLSIQDVVSPYVKLTRAGKYWKGLSPFTKEKTPSFFVSPDRGLYHCFSTGKGGDMFTFVEEMEGVDFKGALKILAEKADVQLVYESPAAGDEKNRIYEALTAAQDFFLEEKKKEPTVDAYLRSRGLTEETIAAWAIGYAPSDWRALHDALTKKGFPAIILEKAGLVKKDEKDAARVYDRFRGRVMFPIEDATGRVVGFSGRLLKEDPKYPGAKYLNSPETAVFDKSRVLYGLSKAREGIRSLGAAFLVEGQLDLLLAHQAGYKNTLATSGTAFTESHAELIRRYTENVLVIYDGDRAGIAAAGRAAAVALGRGMNVKIAKLPPNQDPADVILKDSDAFKSAVRDAQHVVDFYINHAKDAKYDARTFRLEVSRTVLPYVAMIENKIDQAHFVKRVAEVLSVPESAVADELSKLVRAKTRGGATDSDEALPGAEPFLTRIDALERLVLGLMLHYREAGETGEEKKLHSLLTESVGAEQVETLTANADAARAALFEADMFISRHENGTAAGALADLIADFRREVLHQRYRELLASLRALEKQEDVTGQETLLKELSELASELK